MDLGSRPVEMNAISKYRVALVRREQYGGAIPDMLCREANVITDLTSICQTKLLS
jgi:hypothetical protein